MTFSSPIILIWNNSTCARWSYFLHTCVVCVSPTGNQIDRLLLKMVHPHPSPLVTHHLLSKSHPSRPKVATPSPRQGKANSALYTLHSTLYTLHSALLQYPFFFPTILSTHFRKSSAGKTVSDSKKVMPSSLSVNGSVLRTGPPR